MKYLHLLLLATIIAVSPFAFAAEVAMPNPQLEAETARHLLDVGIKLHKEQQTKSISKNGGYNDQIESIAKSLAQLGRIETALKVAKWVPSNKKLPDEIRYIAAQRSALAGDTKRAEELISEIKNPENTSQKTRTYLLIATIYILHNNNEAAQKVLFEVDRLNHNNYWQLLRIAYLFSAAGNHDAALRIFRKAEKSATSNTSVDMETYLLRAGFTDEWKRFHNDNPERRAKLDDEIMKFLLKTNRIDALMDAAEYLSVEDRVLVLILAAYRANSSNSVRARALLNQAQELVPEVVKVLEARTNSFLSADEDVLLPALLSWGYERIGDHENAEKWRREMEEKIPDAKRAEIMFAYYMLPLVMPATIEDREDFSSETVTKVTENTAPYLKQTSFNLGLMDIFESLVRAQLQVGQRAQARRTVDIYEQKVLQRAQEQNSVEYPSFDANYFLLEVARMWEETGDLERRDKILHVFFVGKAGDKNTDSKIKNLSSMLTYSFIDTALKFYKTMPESRTKSPAQVLPGLPRTLGSSQPKQFPSELLAADDLHDETNYLADFVSGLTGGFLYITNLPPWEFLEKYK